MRPMGKLLICMLPIPGSAVIISLLEWYSIKGLRVKSVGKKYGFFGADEMKVRGSYKSVSISDLSYRYY